MKILIFNHIYIDSDLSSVTRLAIVDALNKRGNRASLYVPSRATDIDVDNVHAVKVPSRNSLISSPVYNIKLFVLIPKLILHEKPDVVLVDHLAFLGAMPYILATKMGFIRTQFVFDVRSHPVSLKGYIGSIRLLQYLFALRISKYIMKNYSFLTPLMAEEQCKLANINLQKNNIGYWGCGVDPEFFNPKYYKHAAADLRKQLELDRKFVIFYHGVLAFNRGLDQLVLAMALIKVADMDIVLFILGGGSEKKQLSNLIREYNLEDTVIIHDPVPHKEVPEYIELANIGILPLPDHPNWRAQQPIKLSEYLAMKKPVLATDIPAHSNVLKNSPAGFLIKDNSPKTIATAIQRIYSLRRKLHIYGADGRRLVMLSLTWDKISYDLEMYLKSLI